MKLSGKVALVTGSSSGIGAGIAVGMAREGADVAVNCNRNRDGAERTAEAVRGAGRKALLVQADVGDAAAVRGMFGRIRDAFGRLDILVNNAGLTLKKPFAESDETDWDRIQSANLKSVFLCSREALGLMSGGGAILNVSSVHAANTTHNFSVYAASKGGMEALTRSLAIELGPSNVRVNALRLGWIQVERDRMERGDPPYDAARLAMVNNAMPSSTAADVIKCTSGSFVRNAPQPGTMSSSNGKSIAIKINTTRMRSTSPQVHCKRHRCGNARTASNHCCRRGNATSPKPTPMGNSSSTAPNTHTKYTPHSGWAANADIHRAADTLPNASSCSCTCCNCSTSCDAPRPSSSRHTSANRVCAIQRSDRALTTKTTYSHRLRIQHRKNISAPCV